MLSKIVGAGVLLTVLLAAGVYFLVPRPSDPAALTSTPSPTLASPTPSVEPTETVAGDQTEDVEPTPEIDRDSDPEPDVSHETTAPHEQRETTAPRERSEPSSMSTDHIATRLERELNARSGGGTFVDCPASVPQRAGEVFRCSAHERSSGRQLSTVTVMIVDASGRFRWESVPTRN